MKKVVINTCHGGFGLSPLAIKRMAELEGKECYFYTHSSSGKPVKISLEEANTEFIFRAYTKEVSSSNFEENEEYRVGSRNVERDNPTLVQVVEELGELVNSKFADLKVIEIPDDVDWQIEEYDGLEWVAEKHRTWP